MNLESTTQKVGFCSNSIRICIRDSSVRRKNPRREGSILENVEVTETEEMAIEVTPWRVKPNLSKRIIGRLSDCIFNDLISDMDGEVQTESTMRIMVRCLNDSVIFVDLRWWKRAVSGRRWWRRMFM